MLLSHADRTATFLKGLILLFFALTILVLSNSIALSGQVADVCFVETTGDNTYDFSSSDHSALQSAVDAASSGATIKVAGTCAGTHTQAGRVLTLYIGQNLTIRGGYPVGDGNWNWTGTPNPAQNPTILNANGAANSRVVFANTGVTVVLEGLTVTGGNNTSLSGIGGGIENRAALTLTNSSVSGNAANVNGGGIVNTNGSLTIQNSAIHSNTAGSAGGGIFSSTTLNITNSTISGNQVTGSDEGGGALAVTSGNTLIRYSTIVGNSAPFASGYDGVWLSDGALNIDGSILGSNGTENCRVTGGTFTSGGYNLSSDASCFFNQQSDLVSTNPLLGSLANNGGSTSTHMLQPFSPAIDSIPNNTNNCGTTIVVDQRGITRPVDGACDRGAVELAVNYAPVGIADSYTFNEDTILSVPAPGVLSNDSDGDWDNTLTAVINTLPTQGSVTLNLDGSFSYTPPQNFCGVATFTYFASDGHLLSGSTTVTLNVTCINDKPVVNAGPDRTVNEGTAILLFGSYSDPETNFNPIIFWDFGDGTSSSGTLQPTKTYIDEGVYIATLTVTDDEGASGSDSAIVNVKNVPATVENPGNKTIVIGTITSFSVSYQDPGVLDTHTATVDWRDGTLEPATINTTTKKISGSHLYTIPGIYNVLLAVTDNDGGVANISFTITVTTGERDIYIYLPFVTK